MTMVGDFQIGNSPSSGNPHDRVWLIALINSSWKWTWNGLPSIALIIFIFTLDIAYTWYTRQFNFDISGALFYDKFDDACLAFSFYY